MPWTQAQAEEVFNEYWAHGRARCPLDNSVLSINRADFIGGQYRLLAHCPRCGSDMQMGRDRDPLLAQFRPWTDEEKARLVDAFFQQEYMPCPVCNAAVDSQSSPTFGANHVHIRCHRCGAAHQESFVQR